jgi:hypothetical protein
MLSGIVMNLDLLVGHIGGIVRKVRVIQGKSQ